MNNSLCENIQNIETNKTSTLVYISVVKLEISGSVNEEKTCIKDMYSNLNIQKQIEKIIIK